MFSDLHTHPFYRPLWRRVLIVAVCGVWAVFDWLHFHDPLFGMIALGLFVVSTWKLILTYPANIN